MAYRAHFSRRAVPKLAVALISGCSSPRTAPISIPTSPIPPRAGRSPNPGAPDPKGLREAEEIEREAWSRLPLFVYGDALESSLRKLDRAISLRRALQGSSHPDLIWPLSLQLELLLDGDAPEAQAKVIRLAEERLRLRRLALARAPAELLASINELVHLYRMRGEDGAVDRVAELEEEAIRIRESLNTQSSDGW